MGCKLKHNVLSFEDGIRKWQEAAKTSTIKSLYSSFLGGFSVDQSLAFVSFEDHLVHRGDGVFEAIKFVDQNPYLLQEHLLRMQRSAQQIFLPLPLDFFSCQEIIQKLIDMSNLKSGIIRIFISRGMGGFTVNPFDSGSSHLHVFVTALTSPAADKYESGVSIDVCDWVGKQGTWSQIKSCNYLPNVLLKREAVVMGKDFVISLNQDGSLGEGPTENLIWLDADNMLCKPKSDHILQGCTMNRVLSIAARDLGIKTLEKTLTIEELGSAKEIMMVGTTLDVLPVSNVCGRSLPVGPLSKELLKRIKLDQQSDQSRTFDKSIWLLSLHPKTSKQRFAVKVYASVFFDRNLKVNFILEGAESELESLQDFIQIPDGKLSLERAHDLWKSTCFELFFSQVDGAGIYQEVNVSAAKGWNVYEFDGYRSPSKLRESSNFRIESIKKNGNTLSFEVSGDFVANKDYQFSLTCVLQNQSGELDHLAVYHCGDKPDFHILESQILKRKFT